MSLCDSFCACVYCVESGGIFPVRATHMFYSFQDSFTTTAGKPRSPAGVICVNLIHIHWSSPSMFKGVSKSWKSLISVLLPSMSTTTRVRTPKPWQWSVTGLKVCEAVTFVTLWIFRLVVIVSCPCNRSDSRQCLAYRIPNHMDQGKKMYRV